MTRPAALYCVGPFILLALAGDILNLLFYIQNLLNVVTETLRRGNLIRDHEQKLARL